MDNSVIIDAVRAALVKGGQHIMIYPDGVVSIWPDTDTTVTRCKECRQWVDMMSADGTVKGCELTEMITKPDDYCSYAEAIDNADGETPLSTRVEEDRAGSQRGR